MSAGEEAGAEAGQGGSAGSERQRARNGKANVCLCNWLYHSDFSSMLPLLQNRLDFETIVLSDFRYFCLLSPTALSECVSYAYLSLHHLSLCSVTLQNEMCVHVMILNTLCFTGTTSCVKCLIRFKLTKIRSVIVQLQ